MNPTAILLAVAAFCVGMLLPLQFAVNSQLARHVGNPITANVFSFGVGFCALFALSLLFARGLPPLSTLGHLP
jgi:uncharacterized membrane protein YdcZ (DUF606 family)